MAEFCRKCAKEYGFPYPDLTIHRLKVKPNYVIRELCEGCGWIYLENDDGKEIVYRPSEPYEYTDDEKSLGPSSTSDF